MRLELIVPLHKRYLAVSRGCSPTLLVVLSLALVLLVSSCATPFVPPTKEFVHTVSRPVTEVNDLAIVVDTCLTMDRLKDYISVEESRQSQTYITSSLTSYLENLGYRVSKCYTPFVGCFKSKEETFVVKQYRKGESADVSPPFFVDESMADDPTCQQALARLIQEVSAHLKKEEDAGIDAFNTDGTISQELEILHTRLPSRYVLVVTGDGKSVPGLTTFAQQMATGMATGLLTGGLLMYSVGDISYIDTCAAIIDLSSGEMLWSNSLRLAGGGVWKEKFYATWNEKFGTYSGWVQNVFFYIPVKSNRLSEAVKAGDRKRLEWMILTGTDLDAPDANLMTPLHWTCRNNDLRTLRLLAKHGINVNCQDDKGDTPLHYAIRENRVSIAKDLLKLKPDIHIKNAQQQTPLDVASSGQNKKIAKMLDKYAHR